MTRVEPSAAFGSDLQTPARPSCATVLFVGGPLRFSDRMLDVLNAEFTGYQFIRVTSCAEVAVARRVRDDVAYVLFDEDFLEDIRQNPTAFDDAAGNARIGIAYCNADRAAAFMNEVQRIGRHEEIGFLPLDSQMDVWISVMRLLLCGQIFVPQTFCATSEAQPAAPTDAASAEVDLTPREWQVLDWVAKGSPNKIIAAELDLSEHTVKLHIHNLLKKLGVSNRTCAANWYAQQAGRQGGAS